MELNRTFRKLLRPQDEQSSYTSLLGAGSELAWEDLLKMPRVVILAEAGAGKTFEIRQAARKLAKQNKNAFFLRLENIARDFEDAFEIGTHDGFLAWRSSNEPGWLFLDSVDEARLRDASDFELAVKKLGRHLATAKERAHIVISGRAAAWRATLDPRHCRDHLGNGPRHKGELSRDEEANDFATEEPEGDDKYFVVTFRFKAPSKSAEFESRVA